MNKNNNNNTEPKLLDLRDLKNLNSDLRTLVHNIRGAVGIISSSIEMLKTQHSSQTSLKYLSMLLRQNFRILMETELFGAVYALKEEIFPLNNINIKDLLEEVIFLTGLDANIITNEPVQNFHKNCHFYLLKLVFMSILLPPTAWDSSKPIKLTQNEDIISVLFPWKVDYEFQAKHIWSKTLAEHFSIKFEVDKQNSTLVVSL